MATTNKPKRAHKGTKKGRKKKAIPKQLKKFAFQKGATTNKKKATGKKPPKSGVTISVNGRTVKW